MDLQGGEWDIYCFPVGLQEKSAPMIGLCSQVAPQQGGKKLGSLFTCSVDLSDL